MKFFSVFVLFLLAGFFLFPNYVFAQSNQSNPCPAGFENLCKITIYDGQSTGNIVTALIIVAVIISLVFVIWGGIKWITSGGDKGKVMEARGTVMAAIVGLVIALLAYTIVSGVVSMLGGKGLNSLSVPKLVDPIK